jgi:putative transposase
MCRSLQAVHSQYAQRVNRMRGTSGHLWQGRYWSAALDANYFLNAVRYVERNPVAADLAARAEDYQWSSAAAHCGLRIDRLLEPASCSNALCSISNWSGWLAQEVPEECRKLLQRNARLGLPCGSDEFINDLGRIAGRDLHFRPRGGQPKKTTD